MGEIPGALSDLDRQFLAQSVPQRQMAPAQMQALIAALQRMGMGGIGRSSGPVMGPPGLPPLQQMRLPPGVSDPLSPFPPQPSSMNGVRG